MVYFVINDNTRASSELSLQQLRTKQLTLSSVVAFTGGFHPPGACFGHGSGRVWTKHPQLDALALGVDVFEPFFRFLGGFFHLVKDQGSRVQWNEKYG